MPMDDRTRIRIQRAQKAGTTVGQFAAPLTKEPSLRQSSCDVYRKALRKIEAAPLGGIAVAKVQPDDVRNFAYDDALTDRGNVLMFLNKVFNAAVEESLIPVSPMKRAKRPPRPLRRSLFAWRRPLEVPRYSGRGD